MKNNDLYKALMRIASELSELAEDGHIVNLTPHPLNLHIDSKIVTVPPSGELARVKQSTEKVGVVNTQHGPVAKYKSTYGDVEGLPEPSPGVIYVVSGLVKSALGGSRPDVFSPSGLVRDEDNKVIGAKGIE